MLALCLSCGCHPVAAQDGASSCAAPTPWREADAKPGQPQAELAACLRDQAYQTRNLAIPLNSVANGIIAQCEVGVDRFEGAIVTSNAMAPEDERQADEQAVMQQATADITQYRQCVGH